jgi:hypothetical protein
LGAAPISEAASLSRDRNFVKIPGHRGCDQQAYGVWVFDLCVHLQVVWESGAFSFRGPAYRILEKQNHLMINVRIQKKLDSSANTFAFQGFWPAA